MYYLCILDFEATCWSNDSNDKIREIIEFPSILYKIHETSSLPEIEYISKFSQYVKPVINPTLSNFCTELTGITQNQVNNAKVFKEVYKDHCKWLSQHIKHGEKIIFITVGKWDLSIMLQIELNRYKLKQNNFYKNWLDLKDEYRKFYLRHPGGMMNMLKDLQIEHTGKHHSGISDCENTVKIVMRMLNDGWNFNK